MLYLTQDHTLTSSIDFDMIIKSYVGENIMANNEVKSINERLRNISIEWLNSEKVRKWINNGGDNDIVDWLKKNLGTEKYFISEPFFFGVPEKFVNEREKPLIMVVGQETDLYGNIENIINTNGNMIEENIARSQNWVIQATICINRAEDNCQWENYKGETQSIHIKSTPFFSFLRELSQSYNVCWNNLDKIHYTAEIDVVDYNNGKLKKKEKAVTLYVKDEKTLFGQQIDNGKTLLESEIDIVKPDMVLFVTGPNYKESMEYQMGELFNKKPNGEENLIVEAKAGDIKYYWTYHPVYLSRIKRTDKVIESLNNLLLDKSNR